MRRYGIALLFCTFAPCASAQTASHTAPISDAQAVSLAQQSIAALTRGASISDVTLNANVISILGSNNETGTGTFRAKGTSESRVDLSLSSGTRSDVRSATNGIQAGAWTKANGTVTPYAQHNCWTDAPWFFPGLSSLSHTGDQNFVFRYIGQEQHRGLNTQHIQIFQNLASFRPAQQLSRVDFYLDPVSFLPLAVAFNVHSDSNMNVSIASEILFTNYQNVSGVQVPFHFQQLFSGSVILDVTVTNVSLNAGLLDSSFTLQ
jgi:hypothetical protein